MKLRASQSQKQKLSSTLRGWLPILQSDLDSLPEAIEPFVQANPFIQVRAGNEKVDKRFAKKGFFSELSKNSVSSTIEALTINKKSLYQTLYEQINPPLFPTKKSQDIAYEIIENINHEGYFDKNSILEIVKKMHIESEQVEKIRQRFSYLEPVGIGAIDFKEAFLFQLDNTEVEEDLCKYVRKLILNFELIENYNKEEQFNEALKVIKKFRNPPAIDFLEDEIQVIPDIFVYDSKGTIEVALNDAYYPEIIIETDNLDEGHSFVAEKIKDAKDLVDALEMRKATLYKIGLMIVEYQYDFFFGHAIKPMKLKDLADDLQRNPSTISRAISGKYLSCSRGIIPLKQFFATAVEENISNSAIKEYMCELIKNEEHKKPLSDVKILNLIEQKFAVKMVRRTITKYRKEFNIAGSSERKKLYALMCSY
ncbi:RNA polymerase factor sigma-54 [Sulfurospirillum arcachonense]|uniref:RNA polymerase factor sigma-54 n=1 Tax=Sulfurospirillum arcachonense TaxID=57666 RepID=UPI0004683EF7|nr:RNA polymerase factor sigma-54 [Sulfurospirillum arcachonense]